jgi:polyhydroxyalkanoic acid synthase PhaR subunit
VKEANFDPYGFYQLWLKSLRDGQEQIMKAGTQGTLDAGEAWKQWLEATMATWRTTAEMGADPLGLTSQWLKMMEGVQEKLLAGETLTVDPFTFFKEWYEAISESWSQVVESTIASKQFLEFNKQFLESYTSFSKALRRANEEYLRILQLPSRSDVSHVAELVVALEEKVDRLDDRFEDVEIGFSQTAKSEAIAGLEGRLITVESKLDTLHGDLEKDRAIEGLTQDLERVESKLDKILAALSKIEAHGTNGHNDANVVTPRKGQKRKTDQAEVDSKKTEAES